jgi:uncharacterized protein DUF3592
MGQTGELEGGRAMQWPLLVPTTVGLLVAVFASRQARQVRRLFRQGARAEGIVVGQHGRSDVGGASGLVHAPRVRFTTADGHVVEAASSTSMSHSSFVPGRGVTVFYDPRSPHRIAIKGYDGRVEPLFATLGAAVFAVSFGVFVGDAAGVRVDAGVVGEALLVPGIPLALGGVFCAVGVAGVQSARRILKGPTAWGVVVGETTSTSNQGLTLHHPVVRWQTPSGEVLQAPSARGRMGRPYQMGQWVVVHQHPEDPRRILLRGDGPAPIFPLFLAIGALVLTVGLLIAGAMLAPG